MQQVAALFAHLWEPHPTCTDPEPLRVSASWPLSLAMERGGFHKHLLCGYLCVPVLTLGATYVQVHSILYTPSSVVCEVSM